MIGPLFLTLSLLFLGIPFFSFASIQCYVNGNVLRDHKWQQEALWVRDGKIVPPQNRADQTIDVKGRRIVPGYIDIQINGAFGIDLSSEPDRIEEIAERLPTYGVTAFMPTIVTADAKEYPSLITALKSRPLKGATHLGIHLEGPFLNRQKKGAHQDALILDKVPENLEAFYGPLNDVRMITLAPELTGALSAISWMKTRGIVPALGHTMASYEKASQGAEAGAKTISHLFDAIATLHHRDPGLLGYTLSERTLTYSLICDGIHLDPATIRLARNAHPNGLILITDAMAATGLPDGKYRLGPIEVEVMQQVAYIAKTHTFAGSTLTMDQAVRNLVTFTKCPPEEAIEAATLRPAKLLGIDRLKGSLDIGKDADFLLLNDALEVQACYISGTLQTPATTQ